MTDAGSGSGELDALRDENRRLRLALTDLLAGESRKSAVIENALDCIITMDQDGQVVEFNSAAEQTFRISRSDAIGRELASIVIPPELRDRHREGLARYLATGDAEVIGRRLEVPAMRVDGTTFPAELAITRIDAGGRPLFTAHLRDISERTALEASLRASETRFRALMEQAPFSVQVFAPDGTTLRVNRAWEDLWGASFEHLAGYNILQDEQLRAQGVLHHIERAFAGEPSFIPAVRYDPKDTLPHDNRHDDSVRWVAAVAYPLKDETGAVREVVLVHDDTTARKRAEAAVEETEEKLRLLADTIPQLAWMAQPDGNIEWYNRRWYEYTGATPEEMRGWGWQTVHDPVTLPDVMARWTASLMSGRPFDMVFPLRGADGMFRPFLTRVNPLRDEHGRILYWFGTNTDISDIMRMEEELRDADRRKDEFLATLAHELRNPLAPIRNSLEILKIPRLDVEMVQQAREMMERQVHNLVRLVDDLLDVSRVMRGTIELRREHVEVSSIIARAVETVHPLIEMQEHRLKLVVAEDSLVVDADPVRLAQVVANLLINAAKYTDAKGRIEVRACAEGDDVVISVRDDGIGIAPDMLPRVFELFVQLDHAASRAQGGLGIGLTLVKNLVEMHGGRVAAQSDGLGRGSEFTLYLPRKASTPDRTDEPARADPHGGPRPSGLRILVVDDNEDAALSLRLLLELQGHSVRSAHEGASAISAATIFRPHLVFLDIGMPVMDGYAVARALRQVAGLESVVIVALTGWGQDSDRRRTREAGFDHHLVKPPEVGEIDRIIGALVQAGGD